MELVTTDAESTTTTSKPAGTTSPKVGSNKVEPSDAPTDGLSAQENKKKPRTMGSVITQGRRGSENIIGLMGLKPDDATQAKIDDICEGKEVKGLPKCHLLPTPQGRLMQLCREFPKHFTVTFLHCIMPTLLGSFPVFFVGIKMRALKNEFPNYIGNYDIMEVETTRYMSSDLLMYRIFVSIFNRIFYYVLQLCVACALWDWRKCMVPILKVSVPFFIIHVSVSLLDYMTMREDGCGVLTEMGVLFVVQALCVFGNTIISGIVMQRITLMPGFALLYGIMMVMLIGIPVLYDKMLWAEILKPGDTFKFIFSVFINPIVWEFVLVVSRILARALAHVHESVLPCLPAIVMSMKKMLGRFVIGLIEDPTLVLWASILLGIAEFLQITSLAVRDKMVYKYCCSGMASTGDPFAAMKKARLLRARNAHMETVLEICFTILASMIVMIVVDVSIDGVRSPNVGMLLLSVFIQIACEVVVDFACCAWLTVIVKQPLVAIAHLNFKGWTLWLIVLISFSCVYMMDNVVVNVIGNAHNHTSHYVLYTASRFEGFETGNLSMPCE